MLIDGAPECRHIVLSEEKLDDIRSKLQHASCKPLKRLAQETKASEVTETTAISGGI
jgi:hypothetical protein